MSDDAELRENREDIPRGERGRFLPGHAPKPLSSGRKKIAEEVKELAAAACVDAIRVLREICANPAEKSQNRMTAAQILMDRGIGKVPTETKLSADQDFSLEVHINKRKDDDHIQ